MNMTREEAIEILQWYVDDAGISSKDFNEALDMALKALRPVSREQMVRCRECKHGKRGVDNIVKCSHPCGKVIYMTAEDFCSYGQKD